MELVTVASPWYGPWNAICSTGFSSSTKALIADLSCPCAGCAAAGKAEPEAIRAAMWNVKVKGSNGDIAFIKQGPAGKESAQNVGKIIAVGPGSTNDKGHSVPVNVKVGETVLLPEFGGQKIELSSGEFYIYRDSELVGILGEEEK